MADLPDALKCPMLVFTRRWSDADDAAVAGAETCMAELHVKHERHDPLHEDGIYESSDWWSIECGNGHVLVVPFDDGSGDPPEIDGPVVASMLTAIGVDGVHPLLDPPPAEPGLSPLERLRRGEALAITAETMCVCGDPAGQHRWTRGEEGIEYEECNALGGCTAGERDDGVPCRSFQPAVER